MIVDPVGGLIWFSPVPAGQRASDLRVQRYLGKPVLTWWQGLSGAGLGFGKDVIYDSSYRQIATVNGANGFPADLHEFEITAQNTALITTYQPVYWDASGVRGGKKRQIVVDSVVQEIDIPTGLLLFQWDSLDHVPVTDSYVRPPSAAHERPVRLLPCQFRRRRPRREPDRVRPQHVDDLQDRPPHGRGDLAPRRGALELQTGPADLLGLPARRARAGTRRPVHHAVRQRVGRLRSA